MAEREFFPSGVIQIALGIFIYLFYKLSCLFRLVKSFYLIVSDNISHFLRLGSIKNVFTLTNKEDSISQELHNATITFNNYLCLML